MMKIKQKIKTLKLMLIALSIFSSTLAFGQFGITTPPNFGSTNPPISGIGIGNFPFLNPPSSRLHINNFFCNTPNGALNGLLFRADGNSAVDNNWQLFTGLGNNNLTEKFRLTSLSNSNDVSLNTVQDGRMLFNTNGFNRMFIDGGNGLGNPGLGGGRIAIGNNLPTGFIPQSRVHIYQAGGILLT